MRQNLNSILIFNHNYQMFNNSYTTKCNLNNCKTCLFIGKEHYLKLNNFSLPLLTNSTCISENVVYIIRCTLCNIIYIGETSKSLNMRFTQHLRNITKFIPILNQNTEVAFHFNLKPHNIFNHLKLYVFQKDIIDTSLRKSIETDLINICLNLKYRILNEKQPLLYHINFLTFA